MKKGMKKTVITAYCNNKAEMINSALGYIEMIEGDSNVIRQDWTGFWDGMQWDSRFIFINPDIVKKYNDFIQREFNVEFDI